MKNLCLTFIATLLLVALNGCILLEDPTQRVSVNEDYLILQDKLTRMEGRVESLEMEYRRLERETRNLQTTSGAENQQRATQGRLDTMEQRLATLDKAREQDRQLILDQLSNRMAEIMRSHAPPKGSTPKSSGQVSGVGYEHVVKLGDTLSGIASAYGVSARAIIDANDLKNPNHLREGQKLFIPK